MSVTLIGYQDSVYSWIARIALAAKGVDYDWQEVDPFAEDVPAEFLAMHPFCRVPVLRLDAFVLYETGAITRYIDEAFPGPDLQPAEAALRARQNQVLSIIDSYGYWPMVRQVFVQGYYRPRFEDAMDDRDLLVGLERSATVLKAVSKIVQDAPFLLGESLTLADIHLFPMVHYFACATQAAAMLQEFPTLAHWYNRMDRNAAITSTRPAFLIS